MSNLPPDIQEHLDRQRPRAAAPSPVQATGGIGSSAPENARRQARQQDVETSAPVPTPVVAEDLTCKGASCNAVVPREAHYCSKCGFDQLRGGLEQKLGIEPFDEDDVQDYIFRGYVVRDLKILGKHTLTIRSSQAKDLKEIDAFIMAGDWSKTKDGKDRTVSDFFLRQMNAMAIAAMAIQKMDGQSIGATLEDRIHWLEERGSGFVDMASSKVTLFNQALKDHLQKEDSLSGS